MLPYIIIILICVERSNAAYFANEEYFCNEPPLIEAAYRDGFLTENLLDPRCSTAVREVYWRAEEGDAKITFTLPCGVRISHFIFINGNDKHYSKKVRVEANGFSKAPQLAKPPSYVCQNPPFNALAAPQLSNKLTTSFKVEVMDSYGSPTLNYLDVTGIEYKGYDEKLGDQYKIRSVGSEGLTCLPWSFSLLNTGSSQDVTRGESNHTADDGYHSVIYFSVKPGTPSLEVMLFDDDIFRPAAMQAMITTSKASTYLFLFGATNTKDVNMLEGAGQLEFYVKTWIDIQGKQIFMVGRLDDPSLYIVSPGSPKYKIKNVCLFEKQEAIIPATFNVHVYNETTVHGDYSEWSEWSPCMLTCGVVGIKTRTRVCDNPSPMGIGFTCSSEPPAESVTCLADPPLWKPEANLIQTDGSGDNASISLGDWFQYQLNIDLPRTGLNHLCGLTVGAMTAKSNEEPSTMFITDWTTESGDNVEDTVNATSQKFVYQKSGGLRKRSVSYFYAAPHTGEEDGVGNRFSTSFKLVSYYNGGETSWSTEYNPFVYALFGQPDDPEYIWVENIDFQTEPSQDHSFDLDGSATPEITMTQGESALIEVNISLTLPTTDLEIQISETTHHKEAVHLGKPFISEVGDGFSCDDLTISLFYEEDIEGERLHHYPPKYMGQGNVVQKRKLRILNLMNTEKTRDITSSENQISFLVPLTLLNNANYGAGINHVISIDVTAHDFIGYQTFVNQDGELYAMSMQTIIIQDSAEFAQSMEAAAFGDVESVNRDEIAPGSAGLFLLHIVLSPGYTSLHLSSTCDDAVVYLDVVEDVGGVGYILPDSLARISDDTSDYGVVCNLIQEDLYLPVRIMGVSTTISPNSSFTCTLSNQETGDSVEFAWTYSSDQVNSNGTTVEELYGETPEVLFTSEETVIETLVSIPLPAQQERFHIQQTAERQVLLGSPHFVRMCKTTVEPFIGWETQVVPSQPSYYKFSNNIFQRYPDSFTQSISSYPTRSLLDEPKEVLHFYIRSFYEMLSSKEYFQDNHIKEPTIVKRNLSTSILLSDASQYEISTFLDILNTDPEGYLEREIKCVNERWYPLPSGKVVCHLTEVLPTNLDRKQYCIDLGGYLVELHNQEDLDAYTILMYHLTASPDYAIDTGAEWDGNRFVWSYSGYPVHTGLLEKFSPGLSSKTFSFFPTVKLTPVSSSSGEFPGSPVFSLQGDIHTRGQAATFSCMKEGDEYKSHQIHKPFVRRVGRFDEVQNRYKVYEVKYQVKFPENHQQPFGLIFNGGEYDEPDFCGARLTHIGRNYPCTQDPNSKPALRENSHIYMRGNQMEFRLNSPANWGLKGVDYTGPIDEDTLEITAYYHNEKRSQPILQEPSLEPKLETIQVLQTATETSDQMQFQVSESSSFIFDRGNWTIDVRTDDGTYDLILGATKRIIFTINYPITNRPADFLVTNLQFDDKKYVHWIKFTMKKRGANFPCLRPAYFQNMDLVKGAVPHGEGYFWRATRISSGPRLLPLRTEAVGEEQMIEIELSVRAAKDSVPGDEIDLEFSMYIVAGGTETKRFTLKIAEETEGERLVTNYTDEMRKRDRDRGSLSARKHNSNREGDVSSLLLWLPVVTLPYNTTFRLKLQVKSPVVDGRAMIHLTDAECRHVFSNRKNGFSVHGCPAQDKSNINHAFKMSLEKSEELLTHMQADILNIDFGYISTSDYDLVWPTYDDSVQMVFSLWFSLHVFGQISDHPKFVDNQRYYLNFTFFINDMALSDVNFFSVRRYVSSGGRKTSFRPVLDFHVNITDENTTDFKPGDHVFFTVVILHNKLSRGEASPMTFRVIFDQYLGYIDGKDSVSTNYTGQPVEIRASDQFPADSSVLDLVFPTGVMFPDIIAVNFSLTVDPFSLRKEGLGEYKNTVQMIGLGTLSTYNGYPDLRSGYNDSYKQSTVSNIHHKTFTTIHPVCKLIEFDDPDLQIQVSYRYDEGVANSPANIISSTQHWSAPIRTGEAWMDDIWIQFDLKRITEVTKIFLKSPDGGRAPVTVRIDFSNSGVVFNRGKQYSKSFDDSIKIEPAIIARFIRLVVIDTNDVTENMKPIQIFKTRVFGCDVGLAGVERTLGQSSEDVVPPRRLYGPITVQNVSVDSTDATKYRHVAEIPGEGILFLCDMNPYRYGMMCYQYNGVDTWKVLPKFVNNILGYSPKRGRMYFQDKSGGSLSSSTGVGRVEIDNPNLISQIVSESEFTPPLSVPGYDIVTLNDMTLRTFPGSAYTVTYDGISRSGRGILQWKSCCSLD